MDDYCKEKRQTALDYPEPKVSAHVASCDDLSDAAYSALVESLIDDEDDIVSARYSGTCSDTCEATKSCLICACLV